MPLNIWEYRKTYYWLICKWVTEPWNNVDKTSIRHLRVGSTFNRHRSEGLCYLGGLILNHSHMDNELVNAKQINTMSSDHHEVMKWKHFPRYWPFVVPVDISGWHGLQPLTSWMTFASPGTREDTKSETPLTPQLPPPGSGKTGHEW